MSNVLALGRKESEVLEERGGERNRLLPTLEEVRMVDGMVVADESIFVGVDNRVNLAVWRGGCLICQLVQDMLGNIYDCWIARRRRLTERYDPMAVIRVVTGLWCH
jgi:hypothetical protein